MADDTNPLDALKQEFPTVYQHANLPWGFECMSGWEGPLRRLSQRIEDILADSSKGHIVVEQVKEKLGGLRFYYTLKGVDKERANAIWEAVSQAEQESQETCEYCGKPGTLRTSGWMIVACDECEKKRRG